MTDILTLAEQGPPGPLAASVVNAAALSAVSVATAPVGTLAFCGNPGASVPSFCAYFSLQPASGLTVDGVTTIASSSASYVWVRVLTACAEQAQNQDEWFISSSGDDENPGTEALPIASYAEIVRRCGTDHANPDVAVTIQYLNDGSINDAVSIEFDGAGSGGVTFIGNLVQVGTAMIGTFTARTNGTKNTITAQGQSGSFWTPFVGCDVHDTTSGAQFHIDADLGSATAAITEPVALPVANIPVPKTIANGDSLVIYTPSKIYVKKAIVWSVGSGFGSITLSQASIYAQYAAKITGSQFTECCFAPGPAESFFFTEGTFQTQFASCYAFPNVFFAGTLVIYAGSLVNSSGGIQGFASTFLKLDVWTIVNRSIHPPLLSWVGCAFFVGWFNFDGGGGFTIFALLSQTGTTALAGTAILNMTNGSKLVIYAGKTASGVLVSTGGLQLEGATTGYPWVAASHAFGAGVTLTPANVDANGGLQNPATGSAFVFGTAT